MVCSPLFYKQFWDIFGDYATHEVLHVLNGEELLANWNETYVALTTKVKNPEKMKDLRPCNVMYKFVLKFLANRLKLIL
jgi:hypothetical protein